jgi:hypothetical protein
MNLKELLEGKMKTATEIHMNRFDIDSKEYGVLMDNMLKTVQLLNVIIPDSRMEKDGLNKVQKEESLYRDRWLGKNVKDLGLEQTDNLKNGVIAFTSISCPSCKNLINSFFPVIKKETNLVNVDITEDPDILFNLDMRQLPVIFLVKDEVIVYLQLGFDNNSSEKGAREYIKKLINEHVG